MELTYILVDFENVQPRDLGLLCEPHYRVKLFHGPHQNKLDIEVVKALQPLGDRVEYVQSERHGKNALDFHVAFTIGRLLEKHHSDGRAARFVVVSKDRDFDPLLAHVRSLGYSAQQVVTIRDALGTGSEEIEPAPIPAIVEPDRHAAGSAPPARQSEPTETPASGASNAPHENNPDEKPPVPSVVAVPKKQTPAKKPAAEVLDTVIEHLRTHPKNRPAKRVTLERHILCLLGGKTSSATVQGVIAELVRLKQVAFNDKKVSYALKGKK